MSMLLIHHVYEIGTPLRYTMHEYASVQGEMKVKNQRIKNQKMSNVLSA